MSFSALPAQPLEGIDPNTQHLLRAMGENILLLTGQNGGQSSNFRAILRGQITLDLIKQGSNNRVQGADIAGLRNELQSAYNRIDNLEQYVNLVVRSLKGV